MIRLSQITEIPYEGDETNDYYKNNNPITKDEYDKLQFARVVFYECREVYYQDNGLSIRKVLLMEDKNND